MDNGKLVGVVTVTFNSAEVLPGFLRSMWAQTHGEFLLFAIDNASKDDSVGILEASADERMRMTANLENKGIAEANNQGIRDALKSGCHSVLLINNDTEFGPSLVAQLLEALDVNQADMSCPKMLYFDEPNRIWCAGGEFQPWRGYRVAHFGGGQQDGEAHSRGRKVTYAPTCCVLIRRSVFETIGLMDPLYFVYVDDTDFMFRAMRRGLSLWYLPECRLWHKIGSLTGGDSSPFAIRYMTRNRIYFYRRNFSKLTAGWWILLYRIHLSIRYLRGIDSKAIWHAKREAVREGYAMCIPGE